MFQRFELYFLELAQAYFSLGVTISLLVFGLAGIALIFYQWQVWRRTWLPGLLGLLCFLIAGYHVLHQDRAVGRMQQIINYVQYQGGVPPFSFPLNLLEPVASTLVGPLDKRFYYEEAITVLILTYLVWVVVLSIIEYRRTGILVEEVSVSALLKPKHRRPKRSTNNELGSGDFASTDQIARWTRPSGKPLDTVFPVTGLRGNEGEAFRNANIYIPAEERNKHILTIAKTGSGKTTKLILPILYSDCLCKDRSTIVIDSKPEMWRKLAAMTRKYNPDKEILLFNPLDRMRSLSWNILSKIEDDTDCKLIANTIIMATDVPTAKSDSPFFRNNALAILNSIMIGLLHDTSETLSMPRIHELIQGGMRSLCDWLEAHPHALRNTRTFVELARSGSQNADTIMSELSMRIAAWDLTAIRATTSQSEIDLTTLIDKPTLFIVELRESEIEMLRPLANVIVVEILRFLTKKAERCPGTRLPRPVSLVIDEFASSLGRLPDIHVKLNTLRSRNVSICASIQSIAQIKACYGDDADSVLAGFNTKIFMPALDIQDAEWASKETGQMTVRFQTASLGTNKKLIEFFASRNDSTQEQVQQRAVLTPDEIGRPVDNISTFFLPLTPVFQGHLVPFYKVPEMLKRITEFDSEKDELKLRSAPIQYEDRLPTPGAAPGASTAPGAGGLPPGISNTKGWTDDQVLQKLAEVKKSLDWDNTTGSARKWWEAFENENKHRNALVLRLAEELQVRKATITEFFLAYVYSNTDNIQANLCYLDYTRLKKEEEKRKKEAAAKAKESQSGANAANSAGSAAGA